MVTNAKDLNSQFSRQTPAIVDIMPTLARHLNLTIPREQAFELDGVPLTGKLSITEPTVQRAGKKLRISWKAALPEGTVKVWLSTTNQFEEGKQDTYQVLADVPVQTESILIDVSTLPVGFYKIVLEGKYNQLSRWLVD